MVQIHPDPPILSSLNEASPSHTGVCFGIAFVQPEQNFNFVRQLRCLEIEIMSGVKDLSNPATVSLTQDFFRQARRICPALGHIGTPMLPARASNAPCLAKKRQVKGAIAQLGERLPCTQEVGGSIPPGSTICLARPKLPAHVH